MLMEISQARERLKLLDEQNAAILATNSQLIKQLSIINESLYVSEAKVEQLTLSLQDQYSQEAKVANFVVRTQSLEDQIETVESARQTLKLPAPAAVSARTVEARWKQTENLLDALTRQYETLEFEATEEDVLPSLQYKSQPIPPLQVPTTPIHKFITSTTVPKPDLSDHGVVHVMPPVTTTEIHHHHHFHVVQTPKAKRHKKVSFSNESWLPTALDTPQRRKSARTLRRVASLPHARDTSDSETCRSDSIQSEDEYFDNFLLHQTKNVRKYISYESGLCELRDKLELEVEMEAAAPPSSIPVATPVVGLSTPDTTPTTQAADSSALPRHRTKRYSDIGLSEVTDVSAECTFSVQTSPSKMRTSSALLSAAVANSSSTRRQSSAAFGLPTPVSSPTATSTPSTPETPTLNTKLSSFFTRIRGGLSTPAKPDSNDPSRLAPPTPAPSIASTPTITATTTTAIPVISPLPPYTPISSPSPSPLSKPTIAASSTAYSSPLAYNTPSFPPSSSPVASDLSSDFPALKPSTSISSLKKTLNTPPPTPSPSPASQSTRLCQRQNSQRSTSGLRMLRRDDKAMAVALN